MLHSEELLVIKFSFKKRKYSCVNAREKMFFPGNSMIQSELKIWKYIVSGMKNNQAKPKLESLSRSLCGLHMSVTLFRASSLYRNFLITLSEYILAPIVLVRDFEIKKMKESKIQDMSKSKCNLHTLVTLFRTWSLPFTRRCPRGIMVEVMDSGIVVSKFKIQFCYCVH